MLAEPEAARKESGYMDTRYQGRRDDEDDEDDYEDEEEEDEEEEDEEEDEDDELDEFGDDLDDELDDDDDDEEEDDDDLDDDDDDDLDDDDDDELDDDEDDDEDDEDEDEEEDEELDELEGLPENEWGAEEEQDVLVDDYENEPMPLQGAFDKAASQLDKVASQAAHKLDRVASQAANQFDRAASHAANQFDRAASHAANQFDKAATQAANHFNRPPRQDAPRIEPGFGDGADAGSFDDTAFSEDFSGAWDEAADAPGSAEFIAPRPGNERSAPPKGTAGKRDQGELFASPKESPREESRLMSAFQKRAQPAPVQAPAAAVPQEVIIINVMARSGHVLQGADLLNVLQGQGLRLGDMSIFHRHADSQGSGPTMFSMANMVKPGTFDLATIDEFTTPGVSFFLQMPNRLGNMACFEKMLSAASAVRDAFDAELKDEHRSVFTRQTVEHCRQRVRDFELKLLSRK